MRLSVNITRKSLYYAFNVFLGAVICWKGLTKIGIADPIWSVITVILVSDPDLSTAITLSKVRVLNTVVGCVVGIIGLLLFGYSTVVTLAAAALVVVAVTSIENYPANWRLAPVTVLLVMNAGKSAASYHEELIYALMRALEIFTGCMVALGIAMARVKLTLLFKLKSRFKDWE